MRVRINNNIAPMISSRPSKMRSSATKRPLALFLAVSADEVLYCW